jgi:hypothetical protein
MSPLAKAQSRSTVWRCSEALPNASSTKLPCGRVLFAFSTTRLFVSTRGHCSKLSTLTMLSGPRAQVSAPASERLRRAGARRTHFRPARSWPAA